MIKIVTVIGARPQFIKAATVSRAITNYNKHCEPGGLIEEIIIHTGQHYDENMSKIFFDELQIPKPNYNLGVGSGSHGRQTGKMLAGIEEILIDENPDVVLTYGDTNSTLAGALAASKLHIPSAHVEAGLRSFNRRMPEEINRVLTDEISNILFCPTEAAVFNLRKEGIGSDVTLRNQFLDFNQRLVLNVGDVMYDSILFNSQLAREKSDIFRKLGLLRSTTKKTDRLSEVVKAKDYCLVTMHRPENTDDSNNLENIMEALKMIASLGVMILAPIHPRTRKCIQAAGLDSRIVLPLSENAGYGFTKEYKVKKNMLNFIEPVSYLDMILLEKHASAILTDSGGIQKEAFLLKVPCITFRNETEWIETVQNGWNILSGPDTEQILSAFRRVSEWESGSAPYLKYKPQQLADMDTKTINDLPSPKNQVTPYGNGIAAEKILDILGKIFNKKKS